MPRDAETQNPLIEPNEFKESTESMVDSESFVEENSALIQMSEYYLNPKNLTTLREELKIQLFLLFVALSGCAVYGIPADAYADEHYPDDFVIRLIFIICTILPSFGVLYTATGTFWHERKNEREIPLDLHEVLESPLTPFQQKMKDAGIFIGAALSAVPFTAISLLYPIPFLPRWLSLVQTGIVGIDNTILHFLPVHLAFQNRFYRFPIYIFEYLYEQIKNYRQTEGERTAKQNRALAANIIQEFKQALAGTLDRALDNLALNGMKFNNQQVAYQNNLPPDIKNLLDSTTTTKTSLNKLLALANYHPSSLTPPTDTHQKIDAFMMPNVYAVGALWVIASCAGYIAAPVNQMTELTGSLIAGCFAALPPTYFFIVLLAWIGGNSLQGVYQYLTHWGENDGKLPVEFKVYPKTFTVLALMDAFMASFSYGASNKTIEDNYKGELAVLLPALTALSETGISFIGFIGLFNVFSILLNKFAQYFGNDTAREMVQIKNMIKSFKDHLPLLKPEELVEALERLPNDQLAALTNLSKDELTAKLEQYRAATLPASDSHMLNIALVPMGSSLWRTSSQSNDDKPSWRESVGRFFGAPPNQPSFFSLPPPSVPVPSVRPASNTLSPRSAMSS